eukprot:scaffold1039_cov280-Pinguiococcus_pyrenoidosus.AAC.2
MSIGLTRLLHRIAAGLGRLDVVFCGPEVPRGMKSYECNGLSMQYHSCVFEKLDPQRYVDGADVVMLYNPGLGHPAMAASWRESLKKLLVDAPKVCEKLPFVAISR